MKMIGWLVPPPTKATKIREEFEAERRRKVEQLRRRHSQI